MTTEITPTPGAAGVVRPTRSARSASPWHRAFRPVWAAAATALVLELLWARYAAGVGGDLSAQWAWADFVGRHPGSAYDLAWYGGIHPASYSVLTPYLMALLGVRTVALIAGTAAAALLARLVVRSGIQRPMPVALWGAFALACNVAAGRVTFALGTMFGLAALAAAGQRRVIGRRRIAATAVLALLTTAGSPVAGLFLEVAAAALLLTGRRRAGWALGAPPALMVLVTTLLFPFYGVDPIEVSTVLISVGCTAAVVVFSPKDWRAVRAGALVYALGTILTWAFPNPVGGNVQRLALIFAGVVLLAALCARPTRLGLRTIAMLAAFAAMVAWTINGNVIGMPAPTSSGQAAGLVAELQRLHADTARLEAVPMHNHWEAAGLVSSAELARGWNRQVDVRRNPIFYNGRLTAAGYHDWLQRWAVGYVALPSGGTDDGGHDEAALIRRGLPWLQEIWQDQNWQLFRFTDALPLAAPPATVEHADAAELDLTVPQPGPVLVRISWSPWLAVHGASGACLARDGDWTRLTVTAAGVYRIDARYDRPRGTPC